MGAAQPLLTPASLSGDKGAVHTPPGPTGMALAGLLNGIRRDRIAVVSGLRRDFGPVAQIAFGPVRLVIVSDATLAREILRDTSTFPDKGLGLHEARYFLGDGLLTASSGPAWSEARSALAGAFRRQRVDDYLGTTEAATDAAIEAILRAAKSGKPVNLQPLMARIAFRTIERAVFGDHNDARADAIIADCETLSRWVEARFLLPLDPLTKLSWLLSPRARHAARRFSAHGAPSSAGAVPGLMRERGVVTSRQLSDQMRTLLMAGFETTAAALCWTFDQLSRHPAWAERVANEACAHFSGDGALTVTRAVVKEALRLYPPVWALPRRAASNATVGHYRIARGAQVLINIHGIHRDAATWPDPEAFDPRRFLTDAGDPPGYMPFGIGARQCIGLHVAQAETVYVVARLMTALRLTPAREATPALAGLTLRPRDGLWLTVTPG